VRYPPTVLEEIRARLPVSAVVGKRVQLRKAGREWKGLSPFNAEKTPSFYVNDQKQFYHCFSSGKHGDIFTFLMEVEGLSFPESVERLAGEAGVTLPTVSRDDVVQETHRRTLYDVMDLAAGFGTIWRAGISAGTPRSGSGSATRRRSAMPCATISRTRACPWRPWWNWGSWSAERTSRSPSTGSGTG
jgi:DNA primase